MAMPEYLSPGVYIEEIEIGAKPIEGVSTSTAGFLGLTERGPGGVQLVTGFEQFKRLFGDFLPNSYLAFAVDGFFRNGGQRCYIGRVTLTGAQAASLNLKDTGYDLTFTAIGDGKWGERIAVRIEDASSNPGNFKVTVAYWSKSLPTLVPTISPMLSPDEKKRQYRALLGSASMIEVFDNLSGNPDSPDYFKYKINGVSTLVTLDGSGRPANTDEYTYFTPLTNGLDSASASGNGKPNRNNFLGDPAAPAGEREGLTAFADVDEISIVYVPDLHLMDSANASQLTDDLVTHCETLKDRFAVLEASRNTTDISGLLPPKDSKYAAFYYPWLSVFDPITLRPKLVPPGGYIAGIYARSDQERGVHKAPANEVVRGALGLEFAITKGVQEILNPRGVNCIRTFPGRGIRVWGARTTSSDSLWKYINVRRLFLFLEESIEEATQSFVFEPNNEKLWERVKQTITQFLTRVWRDGALMGTTPDQAFFVKVDRTIMTQDDIDNGRLIVMIGVAPVKPAEFVIFRIAQTRGGADVTE
jgi:hypothetical protein